MKFRVVDNIRYIILVSFLAYCFLLPANYFYIKPLLLVCAVILHFDVVFKCRNIRVFNIVYFYSLGYCSLSIFISILIGTGSVYDTLSFSYVWLILLLIPAIVEKNINYLKIFLCLTLIIAIVVDSIFFLDVFGIVDLYQNPVGEFLKNSGDMQLGKGGLSTYGYNIFYKTTPLLIIGLAYFVIKGRIVLSALLFLALCLSGTRANFVAGILTIYLCFFADMFKNKEKFVIFTVALLAFLLIVYFFVLDDFIVKSQAKASSDDIKYSDVNDIVNLFLNDKINILFGFGVGSFFETSARGMVNTVEMTYFDYFRQVGIVLFVLFMVFIIYPIYFLIKFKIYWLVVSYTLYLIVAGTNPLLVNSTAFVVYILVYSIIINIKIGKLDNCGIR
mgnify:CR=1 FL=1